MLKTRTGDNNLLEDMLVKQVRTVKCLLFNYYIHDCSVVSKPLKYNYITYVCNQIQIKICFSEIVLIKLLRLVVLRFRSYILILLRS